MKKCAHTRMNAFMFAQRSAISKCFPTETATVRAFAGMNAHVNLLRTTRPERFSTFFAWELTARHVCVRMAMIHQRSAVGKFVAAHIAYDRFVAMRLHMAFEPRFIVKRFATL